MNEHQKTENELPDAEGVGSTALFGKWISIEHNLPDIGQKVLVTGRYKRSGNQWRAMGRWQPAGTLDASFWDEAPDEWWNENEDTCSPRYDSWWEMSVEIEEVRSLEGVTHWMTLPSMPNAGLIYGDHQHHETL